MRVSVWSSITAPVGGELAAGLSHDVLTNAETGYLLFYQGETTEELEEPTSADEHQWSEQDGEET